MLRAPKKKYLHFNRKERTGTILLMVLAGLFVTAPILWGIFYKPLHPGLHAEDLPTLTEGDSTDGQQNDKPAYSRSSYNSSSDRSSYKSNTPEKLNLFNFDPNTLDEAGWKRLGLNEKNIHTILNYTAKGGKFYKPEDLKKIWGIRPEVTEQLIPYISIAAKDESFQPKTSPAYTRPEKIISHVDINVADSADWEALPGIGPAFARRIVNFRKRLGGFVNTKQVSETFGLPDSTFQKILPYLEKNRDVIQHININTATLEELKAHPYIRYQLANTIVQFRTQHGNFLAPEDLKKIMIMDDATLQKILPYITVSN